MIPRFPSPSTSEASVHSLGSASTFHSDPLLGGSFAVRMVQASIWSHLDNCNILLTGPPASTLVPPQPISSEQPLLFLRLKSHHITPLCLQPSLGSHGHWHEMQPPAMLHKARRELPFTCRSSLTHLGCALLPHWPDFWHLNTPTWFPFQGLCSHFLWLRPFLPQIFVGCTLHIPQGSTPKSPPKRGPPYSSYLELSLSHCLQILPM